MSVTAPLPPTLFHSSQLSMNMFDTSLWKQPVPFSNDLPFLWKVSMEVVEDEQCGSCLLGACVLIKYPEFSHSDEKLNKG